MVLRMFEGARDVTLQRNETNVTQNKIGETIHLPAVKECNVLVEIGGLVGDSTLSIKFEESDNGTDFAEIATFPIPEWRHGILFAKRKDYVRYNLFVDGTDPNMNVSIKF